MASVGALGIGLSIVFGVFLVLLLAELYYLLFWKRKSLRLNSAVAPNDPAAVVGAAGGAGGEQQQRTSSLVAKMFESRTGFMVGLDGECVLAPPRLLFTIKEETREDLADSEDALRKSRTPTTATATNHVIVQVFRDPPDGNSLLCESSSEASSSRSSSENDEDESASEEAPPDQAPPVEIVCDQGDFRGVEEEDGEICTTPFLTPPSSPGYSTPSSSPLRSSVSYQRQRSSSSSVSCYESPPSPPLAPMPVLAKGSSSPPQFTPLSCSSRESSRRS